MTTQRKLFIHQMRKYNLARHQPEKPFVLASGAISPWYFDVKSALMHGATRGLIDSMLNAQIEAIKKHVAPMPVVGGPANAAYLLVSLYKRLTRSFVVRKAEKDHGIVGKIDGWPVQPGDDVILLEDVITTGGSLLPAIKYVEEQEGKLQAIIAVVDRNENDQLGEYRKLVHPLTTKDDYTSKSK